MADDINVTMDWDLTSYFPAFNGPEMKQFKESLRTDIASLRNRAGRLPVLTRESLDSWSEILETNEDLQVRLSHLGSYIACLSSADARNEGYLMEEAALSLMRAEFAKLRVELLRAVKDASPDTFSMLSSSDRFRGAGHYLKRLQEEAFHRMDRDEEILATDLAVDGINAWGRLYDTLSGKLEFDMTYPDGRQERLPVSQRRSLMESPNRDIRKEAFESGNLAWQRVEDTAAAALNGISGTRLTLNRHRRVEHFLDVALFQSGITQKTLDTMMDAVHSELELPRRILRLKARAMKTERISWYDLGAPLAIAGQGELSWDEAKNLVQSSFDQDYPALGKFFRSMIERNWIDWRPRLGKRPGGFCTGSLLTKESRIFMTYNRSMGDVVTLAHEAGHAFHSNVMRDLRPYARRGPMTLAETASTFGELILTSGMLKNPSLSDAQKALVLDMETGHSAIYLLDIPVRYEFEKALYEERSKGEVSVSRLKELMATAQRRVLGDVLEEGGEDPYFWASKLHFYISGVTFYNFPYTFGFLLSRGLFAMFENEGAGFLPKYEQFLRLTGSDTPENIARQTLGRDLESKEFWLEAVKSIEKPLKELEPLLPKVLAS
ncbi:MAG: hypothetical protein GTO40_21075 [Deltaproteobacteria bacterium]|nr:hypothetical protein [Deltaproteobacteria bacterium]